MNHAARIALAAIAVALLTWLLGWWAVVPAAIAAGLLPARMRLGGAAMALASALAWGLLLAWQASHAQFGALLDRVQSVLRLPAPALLVVALLFPALLGWAGATLGNLVSPLGSRDGRATSRGTA